MNDLVKDLIPSGFRQQVSRLALISPAMRFKAFMDMNTFCKEQEGRECVMFYHLQDAVSLV